MRLTITNALFVVLCCAFPLSAATTFFGPTPYLSEADIPNGFICEICPDCEHIIENFEDGSLDHGIMISQGEIIGPDFSTGVESLTDSVDGDDGVVDGVGAEGFSYFTAGNSFTITFAEPVKSAGLVWTDGDNGTQTSFEAFAPDGTSLGVIGPFSIADDSFQGTVGEDSFFGAMDLDGIGSISITNVGGLGIEIDHVQFSSCDCVPEPNGLLTIAMGCLGMIGYLRRKR